MSSTWKGRSTGDVVGLFQALSTSNPSLDNSVVERSTATQGEVQQHVDAVTKSSDTPVTKMRKTGKFGIVNPFFGSSSAPPPNRASDSGTVDSQVTSNSAASRSSLPSDAEIFSGPAMEAKKTMVEAMRRYRPQDQKNWDAIHGRVKNTRVASAADDRESDVEIQPSSSKETPVPSSSKVASRPSSSKDTPMSVSNETRRHLSRSKEGLAKIFHSALSGRSYTDFHDQTGKVIRESAWHIPDGYQLDSTYPQYPWICPLRHCHCCYESSKKLAQHMRYHPEVLNDNGDGTFTSLGRYCDQKELPPRGQFQGPVVIQQNPITHQEGSSPRVPPRPSTKKLQRPVDVVAGSLPQPQLAASTSKQVTRRKVDKLDVDVAGISNADSDSDPDWGQTARGSQSEYSDTDASAGERVDDDELEVEHDEEMTVPADEAPDETAGLPLKPLYTTPSGRAYVQWGDDLIKTGGTLLPDGYTLADNVEAPWVCPVRSCRQLFPSLNSLGHHSRAAHAGCFNDNLDGTLSEVISRRKDRTECPRSCVVSQKPLDPNEPPMPLPSFSKVNAWRANVAKGIATPKDEDNPVESKHHVNLQLRRRPSTLKPVAPREGSDGLIFTGNAAKIWEYVKPLLGVAEKDVVLDNKLLPPLLQLPQQRLVEWNTEWLKNKTRRGSFVAIMGTDVLSIVLQVVGQLASTPCHSCARGRGPFKTCVIAPENGSSGLQESCSGCANCCYKNNRARCSFWDQSGVQSAGHRLNVTFDDVLAPGQKRKLLTSGTAATQEDVGFQEVRTKRPDFGLKKKRPGRALGLGRKPRETQNGFEGEESVPTPETSPDDLESFDVHDPAQGSRGDRPRHGARRALISAGSMQPSALENLELEEWEVAPGRLMNDAGDEPIAYSHCFVRGSAVRLTPEVSFQVETLSSGQKIKLEPDKTFRWVSVGQGKITVDMEGRQENYRGGYNSVHRVESGKKCTITNTSYDQAVIHINSLLLD